MRGMKLYVCLLGLLLVLVGGCRKDSSSQKETDSKIYPFKSAIIKYDFDGGPAGAEGTKVVYIDQWGELLAERKSSSLADDSDLEELVIFRGQDCFTVDYENNIAEKTTVKHRQADGIDLDVLKQDMRGLEQALNHLKENGILLLRDEQYSGFNCQVLDQQKTQVLHETRWIYQGVALKTVGYLNLNNERKDTYKELLSEIQFDVPVDPECFELPTGLKIIEK